MDIVFTDEQQELRDTVRAFLERATRGAYYMAVMGWQADTPDPNDFLSVLLGSEFVGATTCTHLNDALRALEDVPVLARSL